MLYQGNQNETKRTKVAAPTTRSLRFRAFSRCRDLPTRFGIGRTPTGGRMAAPHLGQSAVPGGTSTRQREQAGNRPTSFCCDGRADTGYRSNAMRPVARGVRIAARSRRRSRQCVLVQKRTQGNGPPAAVAYTSGIIVVMQNG